MDNIKEVVRVNLVRLRKENKLTQMELSQKIGYSDKAVSRWETGEVTPDVETLSSLAKLYNVPIRVLFEVHKENTRISEPEITLSEVWRKIAIAVLTIAFVWYAAIMAFTMLLNNGTERAWMLFIWAIPATFFIAIYFNKKWGKRIFTLIFISLFCWTLLTALYLQYIEYNIYMLFPSGIPLQIIIVLWHFLKPTKKGRMRYDFNLNDGDEQ